MTRGEEDRPRRRPIRALPDALRRMDELRRRIGDRPMALFLDFDGTLAPIVDDPGGALLPGGTREVIRSLARRCPVAVLSGRDLEDVADRVAVEGIYYAGSHGYDLRGPGGLRERRGEEFLPALDEAERTLRAAVEAIPGAHVERKTFGVAVHYRGVPAERVGEVREEVRRRSGLRPDLELHEGKRVMELRPAVDWDKGRALRRILDHLPPEPGGRCPLYVGDDVTDEDAFAAVEEGGIPVVVRGEDDERPTRARYSLEDPRAVRRWLRALADHLEDRRP